MDKTLRHVFAVMLFAAFVSACVNEPPTMVANVTAAPVPSQIALPPPLETSQTMRTIWNSGYFKYGFPLGLPYGGTGGVQRESRGIIPDLAVKIAAQIGLPTLTNSLRWPGMEKSLLDGTLNAIIGGPVSRPEFSGLVLVEVGERGHCFIARVDDMRYKQILDIQNPDARIVVLKGSDGEFLLSRDFPKVRAQSVETDVAEAVVRSVLDDTADIALVYSSIAPLVVSRFPQLRVFPDDCIENPLLPVAWGISLRPGDSAFIAFVENLASQVSASGWLASRVEYWSDLTLLGDMADFGQ